MSPCLSSDAGKLPFFSSVISSFATWEEQSKEAAWAGDAGAAAKQFHGAPKRPRGSEASVDLLFSPCCVALGETFHLWERQDQPATRYFRTRSRSTCYSVWALGYKRETPGSSGGGGA